ncbi:transporter substrate-binding domain-containing protein [Pseudodesulfovibrio indicus]|uniref:substrate-binding periplasmic protein n=1 Tax=Pseudodesulfovibrio indicus TaxID=1716143 RepID=UPI00292E05C2|nr:transporter substrate-binding domain-containing protein [Pseudodesulfovibrio indicus]
MALTQIFHGRNLGILTGIIVFYTALTVGYLPCNADSLRILTVHEPPSNYIDPAGNIAGFSIDVVKEIQRRIGDTTPIELLPERRLLSMAEHGDHIIVGISRTPAREHRYHWVIKLLVKPWVLYSYKDRNTHITTLDDAKEVRVGVVNGDVREEYARENGFKHIDPSNSHLSNLRKLIEGRIDLAFLEPQGVAYECRVNGLDLSAYKPRLTPYASEVYVAMPMDTDLDLLRLWEKAAQDMKLDGTFLSIAHTWSKRLSEQYGIASIPTADALTFTR